MSRNSWSIYINESGDSWTLDGSIYRPNQDLLEETSSTQQTINLLDGSKAFISPETKSINEPLVFAWIGITVADGLISKIKTYIQNETRVKIVTHLSDEYIGYFRNLRPNQLVGQSPDQWDVEVTFERE